jgi:hypothetical protein
LPARFFDGDDLRFDRSVPIAWYIRLPFSNAIYFDPVAVGVLEIDLLYSIRTSRYFAQVSRPIGVGDLHRFQLFNERANIRHCERKMNSLIDLKIIF